MRPRAPHPIVPGVLAARRHWPHLLALAAVLLLPVQYRGGADTAHPHPFLQIFADSAEPGFAHHHESTALAVADGHPAAGHDHGHGHSHRSIFDIGDAPAEDERAAPAPAAASARRAAPSQRSDGSSGPRLVAAAPAMIGAFLLADLVPALALGAGRRRGRTVWPGWPEPTGIVSAPAAPPPKRSR